MTKKIYYIQFDYDSDHQELFHIVDTKKVFNETGSLRIVGDEKYYRDSKEYISDGVFRYNPPDEAEYLSTVYKVCCESDDTNTEILKFIQDGVSERLYLEEYCGTRSKIADTIQLPVEKFLSFIDPTKFKCISKIKPLPSHEDGKKINWNEYILYKVTPILKYRIVYVPDTQNVLIAAVDDTTDGTRDDIIELYDMTADNIGRYLINPDGSISEVLLMYYNELKRSEYAIKSEIIMMQKDLSNYEDRLESLLDMLDDSHRLALEVDNYIDEDE